MSVRIKRLCYVYTFFRIQFENCNYAVNECAQIMDLVQVLIIIYTWPEPPIVTTYYSELRRMYEISSTHRTIFGSNLNFASAALIGLYLKRRFKTFSIRYKLFYTSTQIYIHF